MEYYLDMRRPREWFTISMKGDKMIKEMEIIHDRDFKRKIIYILMIAMLSHFPKIHGTTTSLRKVFLKELVGTTTFYS